MYYTTSRRIGVYPSFLHGTEHRQRQITAWFYDRMSSEVNKVLVGQVLLPLLLIWSTQGKIFIITHEVSVSNAISPFFIQTSFLLISFFVFFLFKILLLWIAFTYPSFNLSKYLIHVIHVRCKKWNLICNLHSVCFSVLHLERHITNLTPPGPVTSDFLHLGVGLLLLPNKFRNTEQFLKLVSCGP